MIALLLIVVALGALLPSPYVVAALPAIWTAQNALLGEDAVLVSAGSAHLALVDFVLLILLVKLIATVIATKELPVHKPLYLALAAYVGVHLIASIAAGAKFGGGHLTQCLTSLARFVSAVVVVPIMATAVTSVPQAKRCIAILLATLAALAAIQFINFFGASHGIVIGEVQGAERGEVRYFGPLGDSVGVVLLLGYVASLCFASIAGIVAFLGGIVVTAGLGAIIASAVATLIFLPCAAKIAAARVFARRTVWLLPLLGFAVIVLAFGPALPLAKTLLDRFGRGDVSSSAGQRGASAKLAVVMALDNPLLGVGYMGYSASLERYGGDRFFNLSHPDGATANANNQFLQSLADGGLAGVIAFGALVICAARLLLTVARRSGDPFLRTFHLAAFIWLLAQVFGNLAAVWLVPSAYVGRLLWILLGIAVALERLLPATVSQKSPLARAPSTLIPV